MTEATGSATMRKAAWLASGLLATAALLFAADGVQPSEAVTASTPGGGALSTATEATASSTTATGSIAGNVLYSGPAPEPAVLQMAADPFCMSAHANETVLSDQLVVNDNDRLRWVFVFLRETGAGTLPAGAGETVVLDQVGCRYTPRVVGMEAGSTIRIVNSDQTLHNLNTQPANNPSFNLAQPIPGMVTERVFEVPEVMIPVQCDVHPWMRSFIGVLPHGFFAVSGADGSFRIDAVPAGDYVLEAWHETLGTRTLDVSVRDGAATAADITFGTDR